MVFSLESLPSSSMEPPPVLGLKKAVARLGGRVKAEDTEVVSAARARTANVCMATKVLGSSRGKPEQCGFR